MLPSSLNRARDRAPRHQEAIEAVQKILPPRPKRCFAFNVAFVASPQLPKSLKATSASLQPPPPQRLQAPPTPKEVAQRWASEARKNPKPRGTQRGFEVWGLGLFVGSI